MHKNAEELSLQTIVIFIIIIVALVIIILAFSGQFGNIARYFSGIIDSITNSNSQPKELLNK
ncbi:MAG: hypothetical protein AABW41_03150 [Nanoarchaeota archaeon]